jgi:hypothetical protein
MSGASHFASTANICSRYSHIPYSTPPRVPPFAVWYGAPVLYFWVYGG